MNLLPLAAALVSGIYSSQYLPHLTVLFASAIFILLSLITFRANKKIRLDAAFVVVFFVAGIFLYSFNSNPKSGNEYNGLYVTLKGTICELPYEANGVNHYVVYAPEIEFDKSEANFSHKVNITSEEEFECGESVNVFCRLNRIESKPSDDLFVSENYYASKNIFFKGHAVSMTISENKYQYFSLPYYGNLLKSRCIKLINSHYKGDIAAAMIAILTGHKYDFSDEYNSVLEYTGTRHLFYPAFIHIMLMAYFICIFSTILPRRLRDFSLVCMLSLYAMFIATPSGLKSAGIIIILILCKNILGSGTHSNSLSLFTIIMGIFCPMAFFNAGFVFSIAATVVIRTLSQLLYRKGPLIRFFGIYTIFTVGLAPFSLYLFGRISIYSFAASFIFMPLLLFILVLSPLFILCLAFNITFPIVWIIEKYIMVILHIPILIDALPFSFLTLSKPDFIDICAFYFGVAAFYYSFKKPGIKRNVCLAISLGLLTSQVIFGIANARKMHLHFIDVGQGDATLIQRPYRCNILIDGGGGAEYNSYNIGEKIFLPYITDQGASVIQAAFVSHCHKDHTEGIAAAIKHLDVKNLFIPDFYPENEIRLELERLAKENGTKIWHVSDTTTVVIDDIIIEMIPPTAALLSADNENDSSMYIKVSYGEFDAAFTGDMSKNCEKELVNKNAADDTDVLKVAHHGSANSTSKEFISAVKPELALIGVGKNNGYGHPHKSTLSNLKDTCIMRTDEHGNIVIISDKDGNYKVKYDK